jgi:hypothetical protein
MKRLALIGPPRDARGAPGHQRKQHYGRATLCVQDRLRSFHPRPTTSPPSWHLLPGARAKLADRSLFEAARQASTQPAIRLWSIVGEIDLDLYRPSRRGARRGAEVARGPLSDPRMRGGSDWGSARDGRVRIDKYRERAEEANGAHRPPRAARGGRRHRARPSESEPGVGPGGLRLTGPRAGPLALRPSPVGLRLTGRGDRVPLVKIDAERLLIN